MSLTKKSASLLIFVHIENYKSIKACDIPIKNGFTAVTGPNGSGKVYLPLFVIYITCWYLLTSQIS